MSTRCHRSSRGGLSPVSSGDLRGRRSVNRCSLSSASLGARSGATPHSGTRSSRNSTKTPLHRIPRLPVSLHCGAEESMPEETRCAKEVLPEPESPDTGKEQETTGEAPNVMRVPSPWVDDLELSGEDPFLGSGAFSTILRTTDRSTGQGYAVKVMSRDNFVLRGIGKQLDAEIECMRLSSKGTCENIVRMLDMTEEHDHVYLRLELCEGDLLRYTNIQPCSRLSEVEAALWSRQLFVGLHWLHGLGIFHRDIKPENLLYTSDKTLKIADFGWCADLQEAPSTLAGTFQYMAPEILEGKPQTEAVDVWSGGLTMLQLMTAQPLLTTYLGPGATDLTVSDPHEAAKVKTSWLIAEIFERCPLSDECRPGYMSADCWDMHQKALLPEPEERITVASALSHAWLQQAPLITEVELASSDQPSLPAAPWQFSEQWGKSHHTLEGVTLYVEAPISKLPTPSRCKTPPASTAQQRGVRHPSAKYTRSDTAPALTGGFDGGADVEAHREKAGNSATATVSNTFERLEGTLEKASRSVTAPALLPGFDSGLEKIGKLSARGVRHLDPRAQVEGGQALGHEVRSRGSRSQEPHVWRGTRDSQAQSGSPRAAKRVNIIMRRAWPQCRQGCLSARGPGRGSRQSADPQRRQSPEARQADAQARRAAHDEMSPQLGRRGVSHMDVQRNSLKGVSSRVTPTPDNRRSTMMPPPRDMLCRTSPLELKELLASSRSPDRENHAPQNGNDESELKEGLHVQSARGHPTSQTQSRPRAALRFPSPVSLVAQESLQRSPRTARARPTEQTTSARHSPRPGAVSAGPRTPVTQGRPSPPVTPQPESCRHMLERQVSAPVS